MKKKLLILFFIFSGVYVYSQDYLQLGNELYRCYYEYEFQLDSSDIGSKDVEYMVLQIGSKSNKFATEHHLNNDMTLFANSNEELTVENMQRLAGKRKGHSKFSYSYAKIFQHYPQKDSITYTQRLNKKYLEVIEHIPFNWKTDYKETKIILNHKCNKATLSYAGRNYIAWYATDIPFSAGPYKFIGLPGLIMKISDTKNHHIFEIKKIEKTKTKTPIIYIKSHKIISATPQKFYKAQISHNESAYNWVSTAKFKDDNKRIKRLNIIKSRNNYIERY